MRKETHASNIRDLAGLTVGTGASDSPQATVVPLHWLLKTMKVFPEDIRNFDIDLGKCSYDGKNIGSLSLFLI